MQKVKNATYKPTRIVDGYQMKKQQHGLFKIVEFYHYSNEQAIRRRTISKNLTLSDAEDKIYRLETKK